MANNNFYRALLGFGSGYVGATNERVKAETAARAKREEQAIDISEKERDRIAAQERSQAEIKGRKDVAGIKQDTPWEQFTESYSRLKGSALGELSPESRSILEAQPQFRRFLPPGQAADPAAGIAREAEAGAGQLRAIAGRVPGGQQAESAGPIDALRSTWGSMTGRNPTMPPAEVAGVGKSTGTLRLTGGKKTSEDDIRSYLTEQLKKGVPKEKALENARKVFGQ